MESMTTARTREYPHQPNRRPQRRRRTLIISAIVIIGTLIIGVVAADRIVDYTTEQRIAESLEDYGEADVSVEGFPVLTQLAGGELDSVAITADRAQYEGVDFTDVEADLYGVPTDTSRPIGTVDATAVLSHSTLDSLAAEHASLPESMTFTTVDGQLALKGSLLGQDLLVGIEPKARGQTRRGGRDNDPTGLGGGRRGIPAELPDLGDLRYRHRPRLPARRSRAHRHRGHGRGPVAPPARIRSQPGLRPAGRRAGRYAARRSARAGHRVSVPLVTTPIAARETDDSRRCRPEPSVLSALSSPRLLTREVLAGTRRGPGPHPRGDRVSRSSPESIPRSACSPRSSWPPRSPSSGAGRP
jgi:hypothetical protein